jgi:hypothetical protein
VPRKNRKQTAWKVVKGLWVHHEQILVLFVTIPATCDRSRLFSYVFYARDIRKSSFLNMRSACYFSGTSPILVVSTCPILDTMQNMFDH